MIRSSRGERPPFFSGGARSSSSARSSSRSRSLIAALVLETDKSGGGATRRDRPAQRWAAPAEHQTKRHGQGDGAEAVVKRWKRAAADGRQEIETFDPRG